MEAEDDANADSSSIKQRAFFFQRFHNLLSLMSSLRFRPVCLLVCLSASVISRKFTNTRPIIVTTVGHYMPLSLWAGCCQRTASVCCLISLHSEINDCLQDNRIIGTTIRTVITVTLCMPIIQFLQFQAQANLGLG